MTEPRVIERFRKRTIAFHWVHTISFLILLITGAILFLPGLGGAAAGGATRFIHRLAVIFYIGAPLVYVFSNPKMCLQFIRETFTWGSEDIRWLFQAPDYYFGGDEDKLMPQGHINTGQKMLQFIVLVTGFLFVVSGFILWFFKGIFSAGLIQWTLIVHDIAFIGALMGLLIHVYLAVLHPRMTESFRSMLDGRVSKKYARSHYRKWYDAMTPDDD